jgi:alkaline phosphatase D
MNSKFHRRGLFQLSAAAITYLASLKNSVKAEVFQPKFSEEEVQVDRQQLSKLPTQRRRELSFELGRYPMVQAATTSDTTFINALVPRLRKFKYEISGPDGKRTIDPYEVVSLPTMHWKIDKVKITGLQPGVEYKIKPCLENKDGSKSYSDERIFKTLDESRSDLNILFGSCLSEEDYFEDAMNPMWSKISEVSPDLMLLIGDLVYVDTFNFVEREKATETDIWLRYIDSIRRIPLYRAKKLTPVLAGWDDHDAGTNNCHRESLNIKVAQYVFRKFFLGQNIPGIYDQGSDGIYWSYRNETMDLILLDDRSFKQPPSQFQSNSDLEEKYSLLGEGQQDWLRIQLNKSQKPCFMMCGTQFINGAEVKFIESFAQNTKNFECLVQDIRQSQRIVLFGSGDLHISEIQSFGKDLFDFPLYELTSSSIHSFSPPKIWENKKRIEGTIKHNFMILNFDSTSKDSVTLDLVCLSAEERPLFQKRLLISR